MPGRKLNLPPLFKSLSGRLLLLTIGFVMLAEVLIYAPSIARFRVSYLEERLAAGHLAILALEATPNHAVGAELEYELLDHVGAYSVALGRPGEGKLMLMLETPQPVDASYDLREAGFLTLLRDAFVTMMAPDGRTLRVVGQSPKDPSLVVEVVMDETPLCSAMLGFSQRILALSLVISLITAALVYLSLHRLMVRPMRRLTESMVRFRDDPEDAHNLIQPSPRSDEIGVAEDELARMQEGLRAALTQKTRLAALGTAVGKINHDLRNMLSTAHLVSDRLEASEDPEVRRVAPTMMKAIDRAISLCERTLDFTRGGAPMLEFESVSLSELADDVGDSLAGGGQEEQVWRNDIADDLHVEADRNQLFRILANIGQNAFEAGATEVRVRARIGKNRVMIDVADNGPGLPPRAAERLFQPFEGTARPGGTGLGLAIARDLARAHGGDVRLAGSTAQGTRFRVELPFREADQPKRRDRAEGLKRSA
ncbi:MAG: HAMP domain-containing sensor histidine kinase [Rhodovibrionaceae bacterium]|nr:HAMP domain-containing sensor histidine kinase [Rhodovibrionaceae bacterium]